MLLHRRRLSKRSDPRVWRIRSSRETYQDAADTSSPGREACFDRSSPNVLARYQATLPLEPAMRHELPASRIDRNRTRLIFQLGSAPGRRLMHQLISFTIKTTSWNIAASRIDIEEF